MDNYLLKLPSDMVRKSQRRTTTPDTPALSTTPAATSQPELVSHTTSMASPPHLTPEPLVAPTQLHDSSAPAPWSEPSSPSSSPMDSALQAITVAQEVSRLLMPMLDKRLDLLHTSINSALSQVTTLTQRLGELETRTVQCETELSSTSHSVSRHDDIIQQMQEKIDDLENRSRRSNLRFVGIPESVKGDDLIKFLATDLPSALELSFPDSLPLIERAHRLGGPPPSEATRPRPAIAKFLHYTVKEKILHAYRQRRSVTVRDHRILIFQDFSTNVTAKRKLFSPVCKCLIDRNIRFQLLYPAKLKVVQNGQTLIFTDPSVARAQLNLHDVD